jgi:hypothetical protein
LLLTVDAVRSITDKEILREYRSSGPYSHSSWFDFISPSRFRADALRRIRLFNSSVPFYGALSAWPFFASLRGEEGGLNEECEAGEHDARRLGEG